MRELLCVGFTGVSLARNWFSTQGNWPRNQDLGPKYPINTLRPVPMSQISDHDHMSALYELTLLWVIIQPKY